MNVDYLIVGSGLTGATIARFLHERGKRVLVVDRRSHMGGNVHDHTHPSGIVIHTYGPHYFRTNDEDLWAFVNRFSSFYTYEPCLKSLVDGQFENWPISGSYIKRTVGEDWVPEFSGSPGNFEEASLSIMPRPIYEKFVKGYSEKQWGVPAKELQANLAKRFDVREDDEPRLMRHKYQGIPTKGYAGFMTSLLEGIPVLLNFDYLRNREAVIPLEKTIFTGPIDEFFNFDAGKLSYRGQRRVHEYFPDAQFLHPCGQVNNPSPSNGPHIRSLEWKHMMPKEAAERITGTVITQEITESPTDPSQYEYPFPDDANRTRYETYRDRADQINNLLICGRLGEYRYFDMDQAIARAQVLARRLLVA